MVLRVAKTCILKILEPIIYYSKVIYIPINSITDYCKLLLISGIIITLLSQGVVRFICLYLKGLVNIYLFINFFFYKEN